MKAELTFMGIKQKNILKKYSKWLTQKKLSFSTPPILNIIRKNFRDWFLGK